MVNDGLGTEQLSINTGAAADTVTVDNQTAAQLNIDTAAGADIVEVTSSALDRFFVLLGDDNDELTVFGNLVDLETLLDGGTGNADRLINQGNDFRGSFQTRNFELSG